VSALHEAARELLGAMPAYDEATNGKLWSAFTRMSHLAVSAADVIEAHRRPDRALLVQLAGSIAAGMCADHAGKPYADGMAADVARGQIADAAVDLARRILARIDGGT